MKEIWRIVIAVVLTAVIVGSLTYVLTPKAPPGIPPEVTELRARITELESELASGKSELDRLRAELAAVPPGLGEGLTIYYVSNGASVCDWWAEAKRGWDNMSYWLGVTEYPMLFGEENAKDEASAMSAAIAARPDGIVVSNAFPGALNPLIMEALDAGIPVIQGMVFDPEISTVAPGVYFAFKDDYMDLVRYLAPMIKEKFPGERISVVSAALAPDSVYAMKRREGFEEGLRIAGIEYDIDVLPLPSEPAALVEAIKAYLMGHPEIDVYFGCDAHATDWVGTALREAGYAPGEIIASGADILPHTIESLREGYLQAVIVMGQWAITQYELIEMVLLLKWGYPARNIPIPGIVCTPENLDDFLAAGIKA